MLSLLKLVGICIQILLKPRREMIERDVRTAAMERFEDVGMVCPSCNNLGHFGNNMLFGTKAIRAFK